MCTGSYDDDCWLFPADPRSSQILLALPYFIHQLWSMGIAGKFRSIKIKRYKKENPKHTIKRTWNDDLSLKYRFANALIKNLFNKYLSYMGSCINRFYYQRENEGKLLINFVFLTSSISYNWEFIKTNFKTLQNIFDNHLQLMCLCMT